MLLVYQVKLGNQSHGKNVNHLTTFTPYSVKKMLVKDLP